MHKELLRLYFRYTWNWSLDISLRRNYCNQHQWNKNEINSNHYVIVDLYWHDQFSGEVNESRAYSCPVVGYNSEEIDFYTATLGNRRYELSIITFNLFIKLYDDTINHLVMKNARWFLYLYCMMLDGNFEYGTEQMKWYVD